ncbi:conserved domain protein [delta proteobacterium NaphS2]|nr:conserved domain protein [delta proteobacterium NaphS2]
MAYKKGDIMSKKKVISEEVFAAMLDQAIEDLKQSGLDAGEVFSIVEENFGISYAKRFCSQ